MKFKSAIFSEASGSIAGMTFSHNKGGMYVRTRATPINPASPAQQAVRDSVKVLTQNWLNVLTDAERESWETYAANVPVLNKLGASIKLTGMQMYLRNSAEMLRSGTAPVTQAPAIFNLGTLTTPAVASVIVGPPSTMSLTFSVTDDWKTHGTPANARLFLYASRPQDPTINFFKGPYRTAGALDGSVASPQTIPLPFDVQAGQRIFFRARALTDDGRLSAEVTFRYDVP